MRRHLCLLLGVTIPLALPAVAGAQNHHLTVIFKSSTLPPNAAAVVKAAGARVISAVSEIGMMTVEGPASLIATLGALPSVQAVGPTMTFVNAVSALTWK